MLVFTPAIGAASGGATRKVLLLFSYKRGVPGLELLKKAIISTLEAGTSDRFEFHIDERAFNDNSTYRGDKGLFSEKEFAKTTTRHNFPELTRDTVHIHIPHRRKIMAHLEVVCQDGMYHMTSQDFFSISPHGRQ